MAFFQHDDAGDHGFTLGTRHGLFGDHHVTMGHGSDLRSMGHGENLDVGCEARQALPYSGRGGATNARVHLIENKRRRRTSRRQYHFERQDEPGQLAAGSDVELNNCIVTGQLDITRLFDKENPFDIKEDIIKRTDDNIVLTLPQNIFFKNCTCCLNLQSGKSVKPKTSSRLKFIWASLQDQLSI